MPQRENWIFCCTNIVFIANGFELFLSSLYCNDEVCECIWMNVWINEMRLMEKEISE